MSSVATPGSGNTEHTKVTQRNNQVNSLLLFEQALVLRDGFVWVRDGGSIECALAVAGGGDGMASAAANTPPPQQSGMSYRLLEFVRMPSKPTVREWLVPGAVTSTTAYGTWVSSNVS